MMNSWFHQHLKYCRIVNSWLQCWTNAGVFYWLWPSATCSFSISCRSVNSNGTYNMSVIDAGKTSSSWRCWHYPSQDFYCVILWHQTVSVADLLHFSLSGHELLTTGLHHSACSTTVHARSSVVCPLNANVMITKSTSKLMLMTCKPMSGCAAPDQQMTQVISLPARY